LLLPDRVGDARSVLIDGAALFAAVTTKRSAAWITDQLGIAPTTSWEKGDPHGRAERRRERTNAGWILNFEVEGSQEPFDAALAELISVLGPLGEAIRRISEFCDLKVDCYGSSDSVQGGFWISPDSLRGVADLNVALFVTVYLEDGAPHASNEEDQA
jgi:hypothetical protein